MTSSASCGSDPLAARPTAPRGRVRTFLTLIRFSHTLFALPYAVAGFALGVREARPGALRLAVTMALALAAIVCARTAAMTFNRLVDRKFDATNPRTSSRASVTGAVSVRELRIITSVAAVGFVTASAGLGWLCGALSVVALFVVLGYSYTKRVTAASHFVLGAALGLAPVGAYLAVAGGFGPGALGVILVSFAVAFWTAGFDILYACQDVEHDRATGLHSVPAALGVARALVVARVSHALVLVLLAASARVLHLGIVYSVGVVVVGALLAIEHRLVRADDLSRVGTAFFQLNVMISVVVMISVLAALAL